MRSRREMLRLSASATVALATALAGCPSPGRTVLEDDSAEGGAPNDPGGGRAPTQTEAPTDSVITTDDRPLASAPDYGDWFDNVENYDGRTVIYLEDRTNVTVDVGTQTVDEHHAFDRPAIAVPPGITVRWEWTGKGGAHNIVAVDGEFDSGPPIDSSEETFETSLNEQGTYRYYCETHRTDGMKGAITVY